VYSSIRVRVSIGLFNAFTYALLPPKARAMLAKSVYFVPIEDKDLQLVRNIQDKLQARTWVVGVIQDADYTTWLSELSARCSGILPQEYLEEHVKCIFDFLEKIEDSSEEFEVTLAFPSEQKFYPECEIKLPNEFLPHVEYLRVQWTERLDRSIINQPLEKNDDVKASGTPSNQVSEQREQQVQEPDRATSPTTTTTLERRRRSETEKRLQRFLRNLFVSGNVGVLSAIAALLLANLFEETLDAPFLQTLDRLKAFKGKGLSNINPDEGEGISPSEQKDQNMKVAELTDAPNQGTLSEPPSEDENGEQGGSAVPNRPDNGPTDNSGGAGNSVEGSEGGNLEKLLGLEPEPSPENEVLGLKGSLSPTEISEETNIDNPKNKLATSEIGDSENSLKKEGTSASKGEELSQGVPNGVIRQASNDLDSNFKDDNNDKNLEYAQSVNTNKKQSTEDRYSLSFSSANDEVGNGLNAYIGSDLNIISNTAIDNGSVGIGNSIGGISSLQTQIIVLDFETDANGDPLTVGTTIENQFQPYGVVIKARDPIKNPAMIFDTGNPTGGDYDLRDPSGELDNVLIISENADTSNPDDKAGGDTLRFEFDSLVGNITVGFLDIDLGEGNSFIRVFDDQDSVLGEVFIPGFGGNETGDVFLDFGGVAAIEINLQESGAITEVSYEAFIENSDPITGQIQNPNF
jgi:hypothetical protein